MDVDFYFVRYRVVVVALQVNFCNNKDQLANIFSKQTVADRFTFLRTSLNVLNTLLDSRGHIELSKNIVNTENSQLYIHLSNP